MIGVGGWQGISRSGARPPVICGKRGNIAEQGIILGRDRKKGGRPMNNMETPQ